MTSVLFHAGSVRRFEATNLSRREREGARPELAEETA
jgi:hypothetical protein